MTERALMERKHRKLERQRVRRNRRIALAVAMVCVFALGFLCGGRLVKASKRVSNMNVTSAHKSYKEIRVAANDTLWDIANEYMTAEYSSQQEYIAEVQDINSLTGDRIVYGQKLLIPYYK
jgi:LysM repeat protein